MMTVLDIYNQFNVLPRSFTINGDYFEHTTMQHSDGVWYAYIYEVFGAKRVLHSYATGDTESESIENLVLTNSLSK